MLGGDINELNVQQLVNISPKFQQIVRKPTRGNKILSVIVTDLHQFYKEPEILPPINPDIIGKGKPSDHSTPFAEPITDWSGPRPKKYKTVKIRRIPQSGIEIFGQWITRENFEKTFAAKSSTQKVLELQNHVNNKVEQIFPMRSIKIFDRDQEWMTEELQNLRRQKSREYRKNKKSVKYVQLNEKFIKLKYKSSKKYIQKEVEILKEINPQ